MAKLRLSVLIAVCQCTIVHAQPRYSIDAFEDGNGPASSEITYLFQDSKNYLWVGHAAGLSKYDGQQFEDFLFASGKPLGKVYAVAEDSNQHIWIGTEQGLYLYFADELHFVQTGVPNRPVYALAVNNEKALWVGNSDGPFLIPQQQLVETYKSKSIPLQMFFLKPWGNYFSKKTGVMHISIGSDQSLFFSDGYAFYHFANLQLKTIWKSNDRVDQLRDLVAKNKDSVYISTTGSGFLLLDSDVPLQYTTILNDSKSICINNGVVYVQSGANIMHVAPGSNRAEPILAIPAFMQKWGSSLLQDKESNFWLGATGALNYARKNFFKQVASRNLPGNDELYALAKLQHSKLILGASWGQTLLQQEGEIKFEPFRKLFSMAQVTAFYPEPNGSVWVSSWFEGLVKLKGNKIQRFTKNEGLRDNSNFFFLKDKNGNLFTGGDAGVTSISEQADGKILFNNYRFNTGSADYIVIKSGMLSPQNQLYFGSNRGLFELRQDSLYPIKIQQTDRQPVQISDIKIDANGLVWISTKGDGIWICESNNGQLVFKHRLSTKQGIYSNIILQLLIDAENQVWAASDAGLNRINLNFNTMEFLISGFGKQQGYFKTPSQTIRLLQTHSDTVWIAGNAGLMYFNPRNNGQKTVPNLQLYALHVKDENRNIDSLLPTNNLSLPHSTNAVSFYFKSIYFSDPQSVQYQYRLIGLDSAWVDAGNLSRASFVNLVAGKYRFEVKATAMPGVWSDTEFINFEIKQKFWQNPWFILSCMLLALLSGFLLIKFWIVRIRKQSDKKLKIQQMVTENLNYRLEIEKVIRYFASSISGKETVEEILWDVVKNCISQLGFEDCVIYMKDQHTGKLVQKAAWGPKLMQDKTIVAPIEIKIGEGIVGYVAKTKIAEIVNDTNKDSRYIVDDLHRLSEIAVPILRDGELIGVIDSENSEKNFYTERHLQMLTTIAALCSDKLSIVKEAEAKQQAQVEALLNKQKATEARLQSMRLQMNPHFLFNTLNSIQQMILTGDETVATRCLSKFSRLLRMVLMYSDKEKISLQEELELLNLYIGLEASRFNDQFEYNIVCDPDIDVDEVQIPTLLVQPFVENAIWHGLLHKSGLRKLDIRFTLADNMIVCSIEDNGIGRSASQAIKENSGPDNQHTGRAIAVARQRLKIFEENSGQDCKLEIIDKSDEGEQAAGTKIMITFTA